ncbi:MAG: DUF2298 domain-containing protein [Halobacteriaceae archaeon]
MEYALVFVWWMTVLTLAVAAVPSAALICRRLDDGGAGLALPLVLAVFGVVGYWVGRLAFGWPAVLAALAVLLGGMVTALRRDARPDWGRFAEVATVFTLAFGLLIAIRAVDPSAYPVGGEKFLDMGLLASLLRAEFLPPEDVWFAGEPARYYYGGHMVAAMLAKLTATDVAYAYNTALAVFYATYVSTAYGLAGAIAAARNRSYRAAGASAAILVGLASNLATPIRTLGWLLGDTGRGLVRAAELQVEDTLAVGPSKFHFWDARTVIPGAIQEFPFFAFLNGDLHAHMMSPPLLLLVAGLLFAYAQTPESAVWRRRGLVAAVGPVGGLIALVNTWSFPAVGGLTWLTLALAPASPWTLLPAAVVERGAAVTNRVQSASGRRALREVARPAVALVGAAAVMAIAAVVVFPFLANAASGRSIAVNTPALRSGLAGLLVVHGVFLLPTVAYGVERAAPSLRTAVVALLVVVAALALTAPESLTALALFGPLVLGGWYLARTDRVGFEAVLVVGAAGLLVLVELVHLEEYGGAGTRFNTVFKTYAQVWALWGVAAGAILADVSRFGATAAAIRRRLTESGDGPDARTLLRTGLGVALLLSASIYGGLALHAHFTSDFESPASDDPTLNARNFVERSHPEEAAAIRWLNDLSGQPNVVSGYGTAYDWSGAPAALTGVPTVVDWTHHESRYHDEAAVERRANDVDTIFTGTTAERARLLAVYDVQYIYVGPVAREQYGDSIAAFASEPGIEREVELGSVVIYRVTEGDLA